jgi:signal transduction histidine kinase
VIRQAAEVARAYPERVAPGVLAEDVLVESGRLEALVSALLLLARLEGDAGAADVVDLDDLVLTEVARARSSCAKDIDEHGVGAGRTRGTAVLLAQVVRNLLDNACRHAAHVVTIGLREEGDLVVLEVADDGPGIAAADRARVFERFVRLDDARARDEGGSGLGLAIVRKIVDSSGGSVEVDDAPAGGARFVVRLPRVAA